MVEAGMPAMETIQSATIIPSQLLSMDTEIGIIAPNFIADIVATNDDPIENINTMENVVFVMKDGKVYKN